MKKNICLFIVILAGITHVSAQAQEKDIVPFFSYSTFYSVEQGPYIETYLTIPGHTIYFSQTASGAFSATVEVTTLMKQENNIIDFKKVILNSPEVEDTLNVNFSLVDIQRFALPNGTYDIEVKLADINSPFDPMYVFEETTLEFDQANVAVSGIQLIERYKKSTSSSLFVKAGYEMVPLPLNFFPKSVNTLTFYSEVYNTGTVLGEDELFLIKTRIEQFETRRLAGDFQSFKREKARQIVGFMHEFDISSLPSGNYFLVVEARNKNNELIGSNRLFFQRSNPPADTDFMAMNISPTSSFVSNIQSVDTLIEFVKCLRPIATENEKFFIDLQSKTAARERLQQFFYTFWASRSDDPQEAWNNYFTEVQKTQNSFSTKIKRGYQTDRGRVYLQYGAPNTIVTRDNEPSSYPYEIWHYYQLNNQRNRRFIFYNRDLVTNDYELLHSDAIGEIQDFQWQVKLNQRNFATNDPDLQRSDWGWGSRAEDFWRNPR